MNELTVLTFLRSSVNWRIDHVYELTDVNIITVVPKRFLWRESVIPAKFHRERTSGIHATWTSAKKCTSCRVVKRHPSCFKRLLNVWRKTCCWHHSRQRLRWCFIQDESTWYGLEDLSWLHIFSSGGLPDAGMLDLTLHRPHERFFFGRGIPPFYGPHFRVLVFITLCWLISLFLIVTKMRSSLEPTRKPEVICTENSLKFGEACEIFPWIRVRQHHTDNKQMGLPKDQRAEWKKGHLRCCCSPVWVTSGGQFLCNATFICGHYGRGHDELEEMDASELRVRRLNGKEVSTSSRSGNFIVSVADGTVKISGGEQRLRTSIGIWNYPERGFHFKKNERGMIRKLKSDFSTLTGIHFSSSRESRVKLHKTEEETFLIPIKDIDASRTSYASHTKSILAHVMSRKSPTRTPPRMTWVCFFHVCHKWFCSVKRRQRKHAFWKSFPDGETEERQDFVIIVVKLMSMKNGRNSIRSHSPRIRREFDDD